MGVIAYGWRGIGGWWDGVVNLKRHGGWFEPEKCTPHKRGRGISIRS